MIDNYDKLENPLYKPPGIDFICITDKHIDNKGWDIHKVSRLYMDPVKESRYYKMFPYKILNGYDASLYIDANYLIVGDIRKMIETWLKGGKFIGFMHPTRSDVYDEIFEILIQKKYEPKNIIEQNKKFIKEGLPRNTGLIEASFLWRDHKDEDVKKLMKEWWQLFKIYGGRDQALLGYLMWKSKIRPKVLPKSLGNSRENEYLVKLKHNNEL